MYEWKVFCSHNRVESCDPHNDIITCIVESKLEPSDLSNLVTCLMTAVSICEFCPNIGSVLFSHPQAPTEHT